MTRQDFVTLYTDAVTAGRKRNFPDMRPSELAAAAVQLQRSARKLWATHRTTLAPMTTGECSAWLKSAGDGRSMAAQPEESTATA